MNILVVNDDGWGAKGLMTLLPHILPLGKVTVVVPDGPRSGMSNAVTATRPVSLCKMDLPDSPIHRFPDSPTHQFTDSPIHRFPDSPIQIYTTDGTPSDCVKLAINVLFKGDAGQIDLVISGINHGSNASINLIYSGTMGACFVAAEHGIPAIGFSIDDMSENPDFSYMEPYLDQLLNSQLPDSPIHQLTDSPIHQLTDSPIILNINAPKGPIHGVQWTRQSRAHWAQEMQPVTLPDGETRYALAGFMVNDEPNANNTDLTAMKNGYISIQPCKVDMTDYEAL
ncbi:MAG: 5'/3'-nucleotidase SurE [Paludibacteraceae bacterium]|nr:5'/3'-nucleotidase SurE [Paludibacteraceae bacterium]